MVTIHHHSKIGTVWHSKLAGKGLPTKRRGREPRILTPASRGNRTTMWLKNRRSDQRDVSSGWALSSFAPQSEHGVDQGWWTVPSGVAAPACCSLRVFGRINLPGFDCGSCGLGRCGLPGPLEREFGEFMRGLKVSRLPTCAGSMMDKLFDV